MRILIHAWGSRGDVEPAVVLGGALSARGHDVDVAAARDFAELVQHAGLGFAPIEVEIAALSRAPAGRAWLGGTATSAVHDLALMGRALRPAAGALADALVATSGRYDHIVTVPALLEPVLALRGPTELTCLLLQPALPTRCAAANACAADGRDGWGNVAASVRMALAFRRALRPFVVATCAAAGVRPPPAWRTAGAARRVQYLIGASPVVVPTVPDWPVPAAVTGYLRARVPGTGELEPRLEAFLSAGPAPVFIGFGSMTTAEPAAALAERIRAAVRASGVRAVVAEGAAGLCIEDGAVISVRDVRYTDLFPRLAGAVTHGGAGTTAAALAAGLPQLVVPHMGDQSYWGRRVHELGLGPAPVPRRELTTERLAAGLRALAAPGYAHSARRLQRALAAEDGAASACDRIERRASVPAHSRPA